MARDICVVCEQRDGCLQDVAIELIGVARDLADNVGEKVVAILLGHGVEDKANELVGYGADQVCVVDHPHLEKYITEYYTQAVTQIVKSREPSVVLLGATSIGRDLAPRLSARLWTGLTADCTQLEMDGDGNLLMTRPAFGGNLFATIICPDHRPQMSTVRPGVFKKPQLDKSRKGEIISETINWDESKAVVKIVDEVKEEKTVEKIESSKILVSCGRGVKDLTFANRVAKKLKGMVSCSRCLVDTGALAQDRQVGQTGKTVRPEAYLAFGISGAIQHIAGMEESEYIVAVNTDKNAPIFKVANLGIVADAAEVLKNLEKML